MQQMNFAQRCQSTLQRLGKIPCWPWPGYINPNGYGYATDPITALPITAHRLAYRTLRGPIPTHPRLHADHLCRNRWCWNPWHVEIVTHQENGRRGAAVRVTACPHGHLYDEANTKRTPRGHRYCRECNRIKALRWYYSHKADSNDT